MKTKLIIKKDTEEVPQYFLGGLFKTGLSSLSGLINKGKNNPNVTDGLQGMLQTGIGFATTQSSGANKAVKQMNNADSAVDAVASGVSMIPGVGTAIGTGLKLFNTFGSGLVGTPTEFKNFQQNQDVAQSSSLSGIAAGASDMQSTIDGYNSSGLFGKLIGKRKKNRDRATTLMDQQAQGAEVLNESKDALANATSSVNMFSTRNNMNLMGNNFGQMRIGKAGMKMQAKPEAQPKGQPQGGNQGQAMTPEQAQQMKDEQEKKEKQEADLGQAVENKAQMQGAVINETPKPAVPTIAPARPTPINKNLAIEPRKREPVSDLWERFTGTPFINAKRAGLVNGSATQNKELSTKITGRINPIKPLSQFLNQPTGTPAYKKGGELNREHLKMAKIVVRQFKPKPFADYVEETKEVKAFKNGGVLEAPENVIVDGVLHAHKHNIDKLDGFEDAEMTTKGMPVVTMNEGGEITQHAEVEKDEVILHLKLTEKLEKLKKDGSEEAKIEAGKLLTKELLYNTKDSESKLLD